MATYFVSNRSDTGAGTEVNPFRTEQIWGVMVAEDTFIFQDGVYQGANSVLNAALQGGFGIEGAAGKPITLKAENDGQVRFDGEGARTAVYLQGNRHFVLEGFDVDGGGGTGNNRLRLHCHRKR